MKKLALAMIAVAGFAGTASAADLAARPYTKAAPMPVAPNWTGFYIFGGGGGGVWDANTNTRTTAGGALLSTSRTQGGDGIFGTVGAGYDWQFNSSWVFGILADGQFGTFSGTTVDQLNNISGTVKLHDTYAAGARLGYLVAPNVLSYVNAGWTGSQWSGSTLLTIGGTPSGLHTNSFNTNSGWFVGGGVENNLNIFGITAPGWFMKTEYRAAYFGSNSVNELFDGTNLSNGLSVGIKPLVQTVSTSLVYRFNWGGPVVAPY